MALATPDSSDLHSNLGRFGLGLKTASFSQCRSLTVVSNGDDQTCGAEWDLEPHRCGGRLGSEHSG
ncbi:ATP-binding protein [Castellaniella caeni]